MFPAFPKKGPMFPDMYVTGEHRTLFLKKGSMFPSCGGEHRTLFSEKGSYVPLSSRQTITGPLLPPLLEEDVWLRETHLIPVPLLNSGPNWWALSW